MEAQAAHMRIVSSASSLADSSQRLLYARIITVLPCLRGFLDSEFCFLYIFSPK